MATDVLYGVLPTSSGQHGNPEPPVQAPVSRMSKWVDIGQDPTSADSDLQDAYDTAVIPSSEWKVMEHQGTIVQVCIQYTSGLSSVSTQPVIRVVGMDSEGIPQFLKDKDGNTDLTLTITPGSDLKKDATTLYSDWVEVDANANFRVTVSVKTALAGSGTLTSSVLMRVK